MLRGIVQTWIEAAKRKDPELFFQATFPFNFSERWIVTNPKLLQGARARYETLDFDAVVNLCEAFQKLNITAELPRLQIPTLIMVGEEDNLKPRRYAELIVNQMPCAEYAIVPRAGHALMWEQPEVFNSLILGFLDKQRR